MEHPIAHIIHDEADGERMLKLNVELIKNKIPSHVWPATIMKCARIGIARSHKKIVQWAKKKKLPEVLIAEDDFYFPHSMGFEYFLNHKPKSYDIYLAGLYVGKTGLIQSRQVKMFSGLHFYFIHSRFYDRFLETDESDSLDNQLSGLAKTGLAEIYSLYPMAAIQHENVSSTSGCVFYHKYFFKKEDIYGFR